VRALSTSGKFFSAQLHTDMKIGCRLRPILVTEYSTRAGSAGGTPPIDGGPEIRCYMRDPDAHLIEVG